jgi:hypothetical protein
MDMFKHHHADGHGQIVPNKPVQAPEIDLGGTAFDALLILMVVIAILRGKHRG